MKVEVETVQAELTLFGAENAVFTDPASVLYLVYDYRRHVDLLRSFTAGLVEALDVAGAIAGRLGYEPLRGPAAVTSLYSSMIPWLIRCTPGTARTHRA